MLKMNIDPSKTMKVIYGLIFANIAIYIFISSQSQIYSDMAFIPGYIYEGEIWRLLTYGFLHQGFMHILFNMWGLYLFGSFVSPFLKPEQALSLYFISAIGAGLLQLCVSSSPMVGASGAVCGFTAAAAMLVPNAKIQIIFLPVPMKMKTFFWVFILMEFLLNSRNDLIAHMAHIGGAVAGYFYLLYIKNYLWNPLADLWNKIAKITPKDDDSYKNPEANSYSSSSESSSINEPISQRELDHLLDKISDRGINSLTPDEFSRLRRAREAFKKQ